ncbi:MAG: T9SS type A sorting domain-containing protein [Ignavibacteria bacterium]|nr:T9SS type A sorting domain-containing protein [Ignavibacteria bacterium]
MENLNKLAGLFSLSSIYLDKIKIRFLKYLLVAIIFFSVNNSIYSQWVQQNNATGFYLQDIHYVNSSVGYAVGEGISKTTNGGATWVLVTNPSPSHTIYSVYFINANTGFAGSDGLYYTTNGGDNWVNSITEINVKDFSFINSTTGWLTTLIGRVYKTTNSGESWFMQIDASPNFQSITFIDENTGYTCGWNGAIYKSTNGGTNWTPQASGVTSRLLSVSFANLNDGVIVGAGGTVLKTTNGAVSWEIGTSPTGNDLNETIFFSSNIGYIAAYDGVYFTTNGGTNWLDISPNAANFWIALDFLFPSTLNAGSLTLYQSQTGGVHLPAATNLTATAVSSSQINLTWTDNSIHESHYFIERSTNGSSWTLIDSVTSNTTSYNATGLATGSGYYFRIYPKYSIFTGGITTTPVVYTLLPTPTITSPDNNSFYTSTGAVVVLFWDFVPGALNYRVDVATDSLFSNIVFTSNDLGLNFKIIPDGINQNATRYYWRVRCSNANTQSLYTQWRTYRIQLPNWGSNVSTGNNLYYFANSTTGANPSPSKPSYNWRDTTGSTNLIVNQSGTTTNGSIDNGVFYIPNVFGANSTRLFGTDYTNIFIGTNGLISFSFSDFSGYNDPPNTGLPVSVPTNSYFGFWGDLWYQEVTIPGRLCYKLTSNELIITYSKAILKNINNTIDTGNYISFQVIINHAASHSQNSKVEYLYNFDESGTAFKTNYTNGTLRAHLIGLQGSDDANQTFTYRHFNTAQALSYAGPVFGSNLALAMAPNNTSLPVNLVSFISSVSGNDVDLKWTTSNEVNNEGFEIERKGVGSIGSGDWVRLGFVQGYGNTNETREYFYLDKGLSSGKFAYRLKQIDYNGNYEYFDLSNEIIIGVPEKFKLSQNYPNPFNPVTRISFEIPSRANVKLNVYDVTGKLVSEILNREIDGGYYEYEFNGSGLSSGVYYYRLETGSFTETKKMLLVK